MEGKIKVYLAGGFQDNWRDTVIEALGDKFDFMLPLPQRELAQPPWQYSVRDLYFLDQSQLIFVFISRTKKYGMGTSCEVGFAKKAGIPIIYIQERENPYADRFEFIKAVADVVFYSLEDGMRYLDSLYQTFPEVGPL